MTALKNETIYTGFDVHIPNLEGDGVAEILTVTVPIIVDSETGEESMTEEAVQIIEDIKARHMGLMLPNEIRELRNRLELTQKEMSELLQAGEQSYMGWESGRARPSRMVNVLLRLLYEGKVSVEDLRSLRVESAGLSGRGRLAPCHAAPSGA